MVCLRETPFPVPEWTLPSTPFQLTTVLVYGVRAGVGRFVVVRLWGGSVVCCEPGSGVVAARETANFHCKAVAPG